MSRSRILVIGSLNMDLVVNSPRMPLLGETVTGWGFMSCPGGKGGNQAVAAARLGADVSMIGCVGQDGFGRELLSGLNSNGVSHDYIRQKEQRSGTATIIVVEGDNLIVLDPGANARVRPEDLDAGLELIKAADLILLQLEIPLDTVEYAVRLAEKYNVKVMLDPAPAVRLNENLLRSLDIFKPNEHECEIATGLPASTVSEAKESVVRLHDLGVRLPVITMGGQGVVYYDQELKQARHVRAVPVKAVDTTAAGDCFSGALAVGLTEGMSTAAAISFAVQAAGLTITKEGAQPSLPFRRELV